MRFEQFAAAHGLIVDRVIAGQWVRVPTKDHPNKRNGAYFYDGDYAHVQNWATMPEAVTWFQDKPTTPVDQAEMQRRMAASQRKHAAERKALQQRAAAKAKWIIDQCRFEQHAYLDSKGFPEQTGLVYRPEENTNILVVPMLADNQVVGCQSITVEGEKKFIFGQRCSGAEFVTGPTFGVEVWCEGYATALSIFSVARALKHPCRVHACFSASNMEAMAKREGKGVVVADNDASGTGEKAAKGSGLPYFMPPVVGHDFNDFHMAVGTFKASQALRKFLQHRQA